jgi:hypothetical protein
MGHLIAKGDSLLFELANGKDVAPPLRDALLHDPKGEAWPRCSVLVGPFRKGRRVVEDDDDARTYFGREYRMLEGSATLPPTGLQSWKRVGEVERIFYRRKGTRAPGRYQHTFGKGVLLRLFKGKGKATLYRHKRWLRLELPGNCTVNWAGFVYP